MLCFESPSSPSHNLAFILYTGECEMVAGLRLSCLVFSASKGATVAKPASVVVSTVLSVVLAVGMIPSSAFAAAGNASASAQAAQQAAPAGQPESNPSADADAVPTQGSASNPNSATSSAQSETAAEQPSPAASTPAIEPQLTADPAQIDVLAAPAPQSLAYEHTSSASQNGVTFTVGWNDCV